ncbi:MAG: DUF501 domain-containing protein [Gammaproteobacteria bacterium]|jgi:hypothetical protein|nr:DUF501 domain-containing protein [Gammaproteobacteria bacterium]
MSISPHQRQIIRQQIGREPHGLKDIAHATPTGLPVVLRMAPIVDDKPFPTLYWLCSRDLHKAINQLETHGLVKQLERQLQDDADFMAAYQANQHAYVAARWANCSEAEKHQLHKRGFSDLFASYGIGGLRDWQQIRCLHMHYAHHLCDNNVIGQWLDSEYQLNQLVLNI